MQGRRRSREGSRRSAGGAEARAQAAHNAYRRLRQLQHGLRLKGEQYARIAPEQVAMETRAVRELWESVIGSG